MRAAKPTTRPPLSLQQFGSHSLNMLAPCFCFLRPEHPADPLIAGKRGEVFPRRQSLWAGYQDPSQVHRDGMDHSAGDHPGTHRSAHPSSDSHEGSLGAGAAPSPRLICGLVGNDAALGLAETVFSEPGVSRSWPVRQPAGIQNLCGRAFPAAFPGRGNRREEHTRGHTRFGETVAHRSGYRGGRQVAPRYLFRQKLV